MTTTEEPRAASRKRGITLKAAGFYMLGIIGLPLAMHDETAVVDVPSFALYALVRLPFYLWMAIIATRLFGK